MNERDKKGRFEGHLISCWVDGEYYGMDNAKKLCEKFHLCKETIRRYARTGTEYTSRKGFKYIFKYADKKNSEYLDTEYRKKDKESKSPSLHEMAAEAKRRGITYGQLQAEMYAKLNPIKIRR